MKSLRQGAKVRGYIFGVSKEYLWELFNKQGSLCALSGLTITLDIPQQTASLDRIDSKQGYIPDNVQWVHKDINRMKQHFDQHYFIDLCKMISCYNPRFIDEGI